MSPEALELRAALAKIACAAELLRDHDDLFARYLREAQHMDSVGPLLNPTLWMNPERQRVDAALRPLMQATRTWLAAVDQARELVIAFPDRGDTAPIVTTTGA